ncbi:hypothetical protein SAMN04487863_3900 [Stenotrophomonas sp. yr243]|nr:hypothetical protein SAMN04487863_3900 [Stenotrophomonas sp. yr243]
MDNHPSCRRLHKIPAHTFKDLGKWPQRRSRVLRSFLRSEPPIIAGFSASSTPFFKAVSPKWTLLPMLLRRWTRGPFVVASRLLCRTFRVRQHLRSIISFGGGGVAVRVGGFRRSRRAAARERILEILQNSSTLFFQEDDRTAPAPCMAAADASLRRCPRVARATPQALSIHRCIEKRRAWTRRNDRDGGGTSRCRRSSPASSPCWSASPVPR